MQQVHPPARLTGEQVGWRLGLNRDEVRIISSSEVITRIRAEIPPNECHLVLSSATRLRPLGDPTVMAAKFFWENEVSRLEQDSKWLDKAVRTIRQYWILKKRRKTNPSEN